MLKLSQESIGRLRVDRERTVPTRRPTYTYDIRVYKIQSKAIYAYILYLQSTFGAATEGGALSPRCHGATVREGPTFYRAH